MVERADQERLLSLEETMIKWHQAGGMRIDKDAQMILDSPQKVEGEEARKEQQGVPVGVGAQSVVDGGKGTRGKGETAENDAVSMTKTTKSES